MPLADKLLVFEAVGALALARLCVITLPFRRLAPWLRRAPESDQFDPELAVRVRNAVMTAAKHVPWNAVCLPQAMAAKAMLARRGCGSSFHLGASFDANKKIVAHAWLEGGGGVVIGAGGMEGMTHLVKLG